MRRLLIVDDEKNIRLGLAAMIERQYPGQYETLCAADGDEALAILHDGQVELMITDIRMPGMDGISLIRHAVALSPKPIVMILSGHDDFQYAKEAIKYEVKEYLLKPIVREEMYSALARMELELQRNEEIAGRLGAAERIRKELGAAQLNYIYVHADITAEDAAERCRSAGLDVFEPAYYTGVLKFAGEHRQNVLAEKFLARQLEGSQFHLEDKDGHLVMLVHELGLFEALMTHLLEQCVSPFHIGISRLGQRMEQIRDSYKQAKYALSYSLLQPRSQTALIHYDNVPTQESEVEVPVEDIRRLSNMIGTDREPEMKAILLKLFDLKSVEKASIAYLENVSRLLNEMVFDGVFRQYGKETVEILWLYKKVGSIHHFSEIHEYFHQAENLLFRLNDYVRNIKSAHVDNREMKKAVQYIQANYDRPLNMAVVSNYVSLNYSYFSELFKEYTGQSFVHYLKTVRIARAKELLDQTDDKVYEIGQLVGFESAKQFNRVFQELEGISASEYRGKKTARSSSV